MSEQTVPEYPEGTVTAFAEKLKAWAQELTRDEQAVLREVLLRAAAAPAADVEGFRMKLNEDKRPDGYGPGSHTLVGWNQVFDVIYATTPRWKPGHR